MRKIIIAIDGYASTGKSSLAKLLSSHLNYTYINSGSMYRAITYYAIRNKLIPLTKKNINSLIGLLSKIQLDYKINKSTGFSDIYLNGSNLESEIKSLEVSNYVSSVAEIPKIRKHVVEIQKSFQHKGGLVMDGRDIGSVVFPNADLKLFLTASDHIRAKRRFDELINEGYEINYDDIIFYKNSDRLMVNKVVGIIADERVDYIFTVKNTASPTIKKVTENQYVGKMDFIVGNFGEYGKIMLIILNFIFFPQMIILLSAIGFIVPIIVMRHRAKINV